MPDGRKAWAEGGALRGFWKLLFSWMSHTISETHKPRSSLYRCLYKMMHQKCDILFPSLILFGSHFKIRHRGLTFPLDNMFNMFSRYTLFIIISKLLVTDRQRSCFLQERRFNIPARPNVLHIYAQEADDRNLNAVLRGLRIKRVKA